MHTGDVCQINSNGSIKIIDRKKNIFKLAHGEYIAPEKLENIYSKCKSVSEIFVYGDALEAFLVAVIVPNLKNLAELAEANGVKGNIEELLNEKTVKMLVLEELRAAGVAKKLSGFEFVKNLYLEKNPFASRDLITTTFKLKRFEAKKVYTEEIKHLYAEGALLAHH